MTLPFRILWEASRLPEGRLVVTGDVVGIAPGSHLEQERRMGIISPAVHRVLDFVVVLAFALAPTLFHLTGRTASLAYALAVVHLLITLATHFPGRGRYPVPFRAHGVIELLVGLGLVVVPFVRHWTHGARIFYPAIGVAILLVWALSRYGGPAPGAAPTAAPASTA